MREKSLDRFLDNFLSSFYSRVFQHLSDTENVSAVLNLVCQRDSVVGY